MKRNPAVPTRPLRIVPVPRQAEVIRLRQRPEPQDFRALRTPADWRRFSELIYGDDRLAPKPVVRDGNVIELPLPGRRSTSAEIQAVRVEETRRDTRRKVL